MANKAGRPPKIRTTKELEIKAEQFLKQCQADNKIPYLTGFYVFLGVSHSYFYDLIAAKPQYSESIKMIWNKFAYHYEVNMGEKRLSPAHSIFMLKNCGFSDNVIINANVSSSMSLADMAKEARIQKAKQAR